MFFKSIEMTGFKSFPDKINLNFEKGITCVVGPNGSGKSNISDAIRWVMGEQSIKTLRGGKMEDVIFSGTAKRKPVSFCEVNLLVDNKDRGLNIDYDEVLVTRRLFRSGESEYYINKASCRLRDIQELFMDTGLGKDGYSLVGQGKIDTIISGKPSERRVFFEEACGISKYHHKKDESERKLENTENNILRINDIVNELENQLGPLKSQSEKAQKYLILRDELRIFEVNVWLNNYYEYKKNKEKINVDFINSKIQLEETKSFLEALDKKIEELTKKSREIQGENDKLVQENYNSEYNIKTYENQIEIAKNDILHINEDIRRLEAEKKETEAKLFGFSENKRKFKENIEKLEGEKEILVKQSEELICELNELLNEINTHNGGMDKLKNSLMDKNNEFLSVKAKKAAVISLLENLEEQMKKIKDDITEREERIKSSSDRIDNLNKDLDAASKKEKEINSKLKEISGFYNASNQKRIKAEEKLSAVKNAVLKDKNRLEMLSDMENSFAGSPKGVKELMEKRPDGIMLHGTVSSLIKTESKYAAAIDSALGASSNHIVCDNEEDAKSSIEYLKKNKLGRVTFLPLTSVKEQGKNNIDLSEESGYIGLASELISCDKKYMGVIKNLLGRVAVFSNMDTAVSAEKKYKQSFKCVTLTGELFNIGGSITGGEYKNNLGAMKRNSEIEDLKKRIEEGKKTQSKCEKELKDVETECLEYENSKRKYDEETKEINAKKIRLLSELKYENDMLENLKQELEKNKLNVKETRERLNNNELSVGSYNEEIIKCQTEIDKIHTKITEIDSGISEVLAKKDKINDKISRIKLEIAEKEKDIGYEKDKILIIEDENKNFIVNLEEKEKEIAKSKDKIADIKDEIEFRYGQIEETRIALSSYSEKIEENKKEKEKCESEIEKERENSKSKREAFVKLSEENTRLEVKVSKIDTDIEQTVNNLWDNYELSVSDAEKIKQDIGSYTAANKKIADLRYKIKQLGNINIDAIEEYKTVNERYVFLTSQRDDLTNAKVELQKIISDMIKMMREIFKVQFEKIAESFDKTYCELFGGGKGTLRLTDPDNILESGIEIEVQPPGKKLTTISLLSGGEKSFTAIALLFSIIKVKPTPFCMFDEIEAALDDNNVYRYADYLTKFKKNTQFVVITHRRGTMESADTLYGITMQEKGVSKLLSINIDEIEKEGGIK